VSEGTGRIAPGKPGMGLALALVLTGLLLGAAACQDLTSDTSPSLAMVVETTTTATMPVGTTQSITTTTEGTAAVTEATEPHTEATEAATEPTVGESTTEISLLFNFEGLASTTTTTAERTPTVWTLDEDDDGRLKTIRVGDHVRIRLDLRSADVWSVGWGTTSSAIMQAAYETSTGRSPLTGASAQFDAIAPGSAGLQALLYHEDGSLHDMWHVGIAVTE
jgi:hypothetical protein